MPPHTTYLNKPLVEQVFQSSQMTLVGGVGAKGWDVQGERIKKMDQEETGKQTSREEGNQEIFSYCLLNLIASNWYPDLPSSKGPRQEYLDC